MEVKQRKGKLVQKLIFAAVGAIIALAAILTVISGIEIDKTYTNMVKEELKLAVTQLNSEMSSVWDGDWYYDEGTGVVYKGEDEEGNLVEVSTEYEAIMDELKSETGVEYSVFMGKKRAITTMVGNDGKKALGYDISDKVYDAVVVKKGEYYAKTTPAGAKEPYYCYYMPLANDDGTVVGMVFCGRESDSVTATVRNIIIQMVIIGVIITLVISISGIILANQASVKMRAIADELGNLSRGELKLDIDESSLKRNDEIGLLADGAKTLSSKLGEVISTTLDMSGELKQHGAELADSANQASNASGQVSQAFDEISKGATMQAESVENAAGNTQHIGQDIEVVADSVQELNSYTKQMKESCEAAMDALSKLIEQSSEVQSSVKDIGATIDSTNESAKAIAEFSDAITEIASQTNLLSLNASIEAARAGDAGKGFAVVATEIGQLAIQSSNSAEEIKKIVDKLVADSEASVEVMNRLNSSFEQQETQLGDTKDNMRSMADNVTNVSESTDHIASRIEQLSTAKDQLVEIISDLSAISEENAASTEETNASMQELNATFAIFSESARKLEELAQNMTDAISYFKP